MALTDAPPSEPPSAPATPQSFGKLAIPAVPQSCDKIPTTSWELEPGLDLPDLPDVSAVLKDWGIDEETAPAAQTSTTPAAQTISKDAGKANPAAETLRTAVVGWTAVVDPPSDIRWGQTSSFMHDPDIQAALAVQPHDPGHQAISKGAKQRPPRARAKSQSTKGKGMGHNTHRKGKGKGHQTHSEGKGKAITPTKSKEPRTSSASTITPEKVHSRCEMSAES